jgi:hypothetical protein
MGCNFYTLKGKHIGKRSAAGYYCWECKITLCKDGEKRIHRSDSRWYKACPKCHKKPITETITQGAVGRELGFNKTPFAPRTGVTTCSSFSWAMEKTNIAKVRFVLDEYGKRFTLKEFDAILSECPVQYFHHIGQEFS